MRLAMLVAVVVLTGCQTEGAVPEAHESDPNLVYRTRVVLATADHAEQVTRDVINPQTQADERAARPALLAQKQSGVFLEIAKDASCAGADLWLFDHANLTGNELCFFGLGVAALSSYQDGCLSSPPICWSWSGEVRSYWAGTQDGWFIVSGSVDLGQITFDREDYWMNASPNVAAATGVELYANCPQGGCY